jgi:serine/threonine protein kinase
MESSSDFIVPADFSSEWRNITLIKSHSRTNIYTATRYGRRFVLKALVPEIASLTDYRLQQEQEFQLGIQLVHPNIAATYSLEEIDGVGRCIVQEWIDGQTLAEWLQTNPSMALRERVLNQLLDALEYIHSLQLVHHDLKTDNILITRHGSNAKLIDFGLSATDASVSLVANDPRRDIIALQQLFPDICSTGQFDTIDALRKAINRRKRFVRLLPIIFSALLLTAAITLFYLSWHERQKEQRRFETMTEQVDSYIAKERAHLLEIINRRDSFDANNPVDRQAHIACHEEYSNYVQSQWIIRDSLMNMYPENDPLREQFWQLWVHREAEMNTELMHILSSKLK